MARLRIELDNETFERLTEAAVTERRPLVWQAEVLLRRALGLPFPSVVGPDGLQDFKAQPDLTLDASHDLSK